ncbi:hypothetical protein [Algoriphagus sp.]|uniref:hypothetical protein n=1 Tax=Algoriphagus sp. TaxID=1872435 RepID=UPI003F6F7B26
MIINLIELLEKDVFFENWLDLGKVSEDTLDALSIFEINIVNAGKLITEFYLSSLLNGEYALISIDKLKEDKAELEQYLLGITEQFERIGSLTTETKFGDSPSEYLYLFQQTYAENLIDALDKFIYSNYFNLIIDLDNQFKFQNKYKLAQKNNIQFSEIEDQSYRSYLKAFVLGVKICQLEHFEYKFSKETVQNVYHLWFEMREICNFNESQILYGLLIKIDFIYKKFIYRNRLEKREKRNFRFFAELQSEQEISIEHFNKEENFQAWEERLLIHYELNESWDECLNVEESEIFNSQRERLTLFDYHVLTKSYKDVSKNSDRLMKLYENFKEDFKNLPRTNFDKYALKVSDGYIFNNYLSGKLSSNEYSIDLVKSFKKSLSEKQNSSGIQNYFPWQLLCLEIIKRLEVLSVELFNSEKYFEFKETVDLLNDTISSLDSSFDWSSEKSFMPFQFIHEYCYSDYQLVNKFTEDKQYLFFFTSYFLPSTYSYFEIVKNEIKSKKIKFEALGEFYNSIKSIVTEVKTNSEKVNSSERRSIEVLGIFSAVALFTIGSIQIFSFKTVALDPMIYYNFILSFGYSLAIFVLLIWIITRQNYSKVSIYHFLVLLTLIVSSIFVVNYFVDNVRGLENKQDIQLE